MKFLLSICPFLVHSEHYINVNHHDVTNSIDRSLCTGCRNLWEGIESNLIESKNKGSSKNWQTSEIRMAEVLDASNLCLKVRNVLKFTCVKFLEEHEEEIEEWFEFGNDERPK